MKRILYTTTAVLTLAVAAGPALAGNLDEPLIVPAPVPMAAPAPVYSGGDWGGFYAGGSLGYADASEAGGAFDDDGATYGIHGGYDYDFGSFVIGGELEFSGFDLADGANEVDSVTRAKVRAGYDGGNYMPYVTVGLASLDIGGLNASDEGAVYGLGLDYKMTDTIRVGGEVLKHEFNDFDGTGLDFDATTASLRVSFEF